MPEIAPFLLDGHDLDDTSDCNAVEHGWLFGDIAQLAMRIEITWT